MALAFSFREASNDSDPPPPSAKDKRPTQGEQVRIYALGRQSVMHGIFNEVGQRIALFYWHVYKAIEGNQIKVVWLY